MQQQCTGGLVVPHDAVAARKIDDGRGQRMLRSQHREFVESVVKVTHWPI